MNGVHLKVNMALHLKRVTFKAIGYYSQPEPQHQTSNWQVYAPCENNDFTACVLFSQIQQMTSKGDQKAALLALKKLIQVAALAQPLTVHYDKKACHELHRFVYEGKERVIWRIRHGDIRLPFYYGQGKLIFLAGALPKRKDRLTTAETAALEKEVKRYIDAEAAGELVYEPPRC